MNKKILHLTLHKQWFDEIAEGKKIEEYRDFKDYWKKRLENREYDEVWFRNGYAKDCPFMRVEYKGLRIDEKEYAILLGEIFEIKNWNK